MGQTRVQSLILILLWISGWGKTDSCNQYISSLLQEAEVTVIIVIVNNTTNVTMIFIYIHVNIKVSKKSFFR